MTKKNTVPVESNEMPFFKTAQAMADVLTLVASSMCQSVELTAVENVLKRWENEKAARND